jgi:hypothetical protein
MPPILHSNSLDIVLLGASCEAYYSLCIVLLAMKQGCGYNAGS